MEEGFPIPSHWSKAGGDLGRWNAAGFRMLGVAPAWHLPGDKNLHPTTITNWSPQQLESAWEVIHPQNFQEGMSCYQYLDSSCVRCWAEESSQSWCTQTSDLQNCVIINGFLSHWCGIICYISSIKEIHLSSGIVSEVYPSQEHLQFNHDYYLWN